MRYNYSSRKPEPERGAREQSATLTITGVGYYALALEIDETLAGHHCYIRLSLDEVGRGTLIGLPLASALNPERKPQIIVTYIAEKDLEKMLLVTEAGFGHASRMLKYLFSRMQ
jgi:hypothetical protein